MPTLVTKREPLCPTYSRDYIAKLAANLGFKVELVPQYCTTKGHKYRNRAQPYSVRRLTINEIGCIVYTVRTRQNQSRKRYAQASLKRPKDPPPVIVYHVTGGPEPDRVFIVRRFDVESKFVSKVNIPLHSEVWCGYGFKWGEFENRWALFHKPMNS